MLHDAATDTLTHALWINEDRINSSCHWIKDPRCDNQPLLLRDVKVLFNRLSELPCYLSGYPGFEKIARVVTAALSQDCAPPNS
jgi:hypothetical protein